MNVISALAAALRIETLPDILGEIAGSTLAAAAKSDMSQVPKALASPTDPQARAQVVQTAIQAAATRQDSAAPLLANLDAILREPNLPPDLRAAASRVAALATPLAPDSPLPDIARAFSQSGVLLEARLGADPALPPIDWKAALVGLKAVVERLAAPADVAVPSTITAQRDWSVALVRLNEVADRLGAPSPAVPPAANAAPADWKAAVVNLKIVVDHLISAPDTASPSADWKAAVAGLKTVVDRLAAQPSNTLPLAPTAPPPEWRGALASLKTIVDRLALPPTDAAPPADVKANLANLKVIADRLAPPAADATSPPESHTHAPTAPPPSTAGPLTGQPASPPAQAEPDRLVQQVSSALARNELLQIASLPQASATSRTDGGQGWMFEIPFATPQGPAIGQFEISRDGRRPGGDEQAAAWHVRFAIDIEPAGPVQAHVTLGEGQGRVALWAERPETQARLLRDKSTLSAALNGAEISVYPRAPVSSPPSAGSLVDRQT
jgi:hypothetical protein